MTDAPAESANGQPTAKQAALAAEAAAAAGATPAPDASSAAESADPTLPAAPAAVVPAADERPEIAVGAAFAGGLALAFLLKRLVR